MNQLPKSTNFFCRQNVVNKIKLASIFNNKKTTTVKIGKFPRYSSNYKVEPYIM